jgi:hypothetical protein
MWQAGHVGRMGQTRIVYRIFVGKFLPRPRRWEGNIKLCLGEVNYEDGR